MPRRPRILPAVLLTAAVAVLAPAAVAVPAAAPTGPTVPDPYYPADGNSGYDVLHYDIHDRYRFSDQRLDGWTTIRLKPLEDLTTFDVDLLLDVVDVTVDGVAADVARADEHEVAITPATPLEAGEPVDVRVRYRGYPARIRWDGESNWLADRHEVVTMNEPHMAAWWFPSNDHPSDKARFDIHVRTGKGREVISNGVRVGRRVHGTTATTHWRMTDPMTTYLAFFAAGDFAIEQGRAHGLRYYNAVSRQLGARSQQASLASLRKSARLTAWLADELGDYPFATTGGVVTSLGPGFALENQSRPTYPGNPSEILLVHELAHQWFGDAVSVARWRDIWLNEGFATYMEKRFNEAEGGQSTGRWLQRAYRSVGHEFWDLDIADPCASTTPCSIYTLFASQVYDRGAMTLAALRNRIGAPDFRRLLRRWVADHGGGNATSEEFEALAEQVSGTQLDAFFGAWLSGDGPPPNRPAYGL